MEKVIFQIKYNDKIYNKFILLAKEVNKEGKDIYKAKELIANKDIHIQYYNRLFVEGDFDNSLTEIDFQKVLDFMKNFEVVKYIDNGFEKIEEILK